jgi:predicted DNA repair protein MutK
VAKAAISACVSLPIGLDDTKVASVSDVLVETKYVPAAAAGVVVDDARLSTAGFIIVSFISTQLAAFTIPLE